MAPHGERAAHISRSGREYWSRRPGQRMGHWGRFSKWLTHRKERRIARKAAREAQRIVTAQDPLGLDRL